MAVLTAPAAWRLIPSLAICLPLLAGCATPPKDPAQLAEFQQTNDPLEPMNRTFFDINEAALKYVLTPADIVYRGVVPDPARKGVHSALGNLKEPVVFMNKALQGNLSSAGTSVARFLVNTIFGFGGLIDVASHNDIQEPQGGDFGATLYTYGIGEGPYLFIPLLGPSNPRDLVGRVADGEADPWGWILYTTYPEQIGVFAGKGLDDYDQIRDQLDEERRTSIDFYALLRSAYRQNRRYEVSGGKDTGSDDLYNVPSKSAEHP